MNNYDYKAEKFLDRLYSDLYLEDEVMHTAKPSDSKEEKIRKYLNRLEKVDEIAKNSKYNGIDLLKRLYYKKYVIKEENIPEAYFELQKKMALERGFGHVEISSSIRQELINTVIEDQKKSLDMWLDYFLSNDSMYPEWFKYYAFQGMLKLGSYDKEKATFSKRTESTTNVFVDLNREALALVYDNLAKSINGENVDDEVLNKLLKGGSFKKLYTHFINVLGSVEKDISSNDGIWVKYDQGSNPDKLVKSLEGKGTGWCTAGASTAKIQLEEGDFYVYYTKDSNGEYKQPRIAIRMDGTNQIGEIRGIASHQNLESEMEEVLEEKLKEFPDRDKYKKKVSDMKKLTDLYDRFIKNNEKIKELRDEIGPLPDDNLSFDEEIFDDDTELKVNKVIGLYDYREGNIFNDDELRFLYQIDSKIDGFGYGEDPRINEILNNRLIDKDLASIFKCNVDEISHDICDLYSEKKVVCFVGEARITDLKNITFPKYCYGNLTIEENHAISDVILPEKIFGNLSFDNVEKISNVIFPKDVRGSLFLNYLKSVENVVFPERAKELYSTASKASNVTFPKYVDTTFQLSFLRSAFNVVFPEEIGEDCHLNSLANIIDVTFPTTIGGDFKIGLIKANQDTTFPKYVGGNFAAYDLNEANNTVFSEIVGGNLILPTLGAAYNTVFPKKVNGDFHVSSLKNVKNITLPEYVGQCVDLQALDYIDNLELPKYIGRSIYLNYLEKIKGVVFPKHMDGDIKMPHLKTATNVVFPNTLNGSLMLNNLENAKNIVLPERIGGDLDLGLPSIDEKIEFPQIVGRNLVMEFLTSAKNVVFPQVVGLDLALYGLKHAENVILPDLVVQYVNLNNLEFAKNVVLPRKVKDTLFLNKLNSTDGLIIPENFKYNNLESRITINDLVKKSLKNEDTPKKIGTRAYSSIIILSVLTTLISIGLIVLGVFFNR